MKKVNELDECRRDEIYKKLIEKRPFVYKIYNQIYILGYHTFVKDDKNTTTELFEEYVRCWEELSKKVNITKYDVIQLLDVYMRINNIINVFDENKNNNELICKLFVDMSDEEYNSISQQIERFIYCIDFSQSIFYRYNSKNSFK